MKKKEFIKELEKNLHGLPKEDMKEILEDYEEHFKVAKKKKRKESEISESLGNPKEIAKEAKKELGKEDTLKDLFKEFWINFEKLVKEIWASIKEIIKGEYPQAKKTLKTALNTFKKTIKNTFKKRKNKKIKRWKIVSLIFLNILLFIPIWLALFATLLALVISGWTIFFTGIAIIFSSIFLLAMPFSNPVNNVLFSLLFAGIGTFFLGNFFSGIFWKLNKGYFKLTKRFFKWNKKIFKGGENEKRK